MSLQHSNSRALLLKAAMKDWDILKDEYIPRDVLAPINYDSKGQPVFSGTSSSSISESEITTIRQWIQEDLYEDIWDDLLKSISPSYNQKNNRIFEADFVGSEALYLLLCTPDIDISLIREMFQAWHGFTMSTKGFDDQTWSSNMLYIWFLHPQLTSIDIDDTFKKMDEIVAYKNVFRWDQELRNMLYTRADLLPSVLIRELSQAKEDLNDEILDDWSSALKNPNFPVQLFDFALDNYLLETSRSSLQEHLLHYILGNPACSEPYYSIFMSKLCDLSNDIFYLNEAAIDSRCSPELVVKALETLYRNGKLSTSSELADYAIDFEPAFNLVLRSLNYEEDTIEALPFAMKFHLLVGSTL